MKILFMGTPDFAVPSFRKLLQSPWEIVGAVTQPDRPRGRNRVVSPSPVKVLAEETGIPCFQPQRLRTDESVSRINGFGADLIVVVAYGQILPKEILGRPMLGCVNLHASLLPKYRGAAPIPYALMRGETRTGVTTMKMNEEMDAGDIYLQEEIPITPLDTQGTLHDKLADVGADLLVRTIGELMRGKLTPVPQNHSLATYAPKLDTAICAIPWETDAVKIDLLIRGLSPVPGAYSYLGPDRVKIYFSKTFEGSGGGVPGAVLSLGEEGIRVAGSKGSILVTDLQLENKKRMSAGEFIRGRHVRVGDIFYVL